MNTIQLKIKQSGTVDCPICYNKFNWSYKMETMPMENGRMASCFDVKPHYNLVSHYFNDSGKVIFRICCEICNSCIETKPMDLIEEAGSAD